jgi:5-methylcytosine-specific restriction endonuclease McrA
MSMRECSYERFTDADLLAEMKCLTARERAATADLLRCLMEVDARRLYLREACSSLFTYCTQVLHLGEGAAYNRIEAARAARRFPRVLDGIADGALTLTSVRLLAPHLTVENHGQLLDAARHKAKRDLEMLIASLHPQPPAPTVLRKLPAVAQVTPTTRPAASGRSVQTMPTECSSVLNSARPHGGEPEADEQRQTVGPRVGSARCERQLITPLSACDYKLQVTITDETHSKLRRAQDLMRHSIPDADLAKLLDRALTLLLENLEKRRCASAMRIRPGTPPSGNTRHIPAAVKREVWRRDRGQCAFSRGTRRCTETAFLEFHHVVPYAHGGAATVSNIELRCRAHNQYEATLLFGAGADMVREAGC